MSVPGHQTIHGGDEGLRHHLCLSHDEHREAGADPAEMERWHEEEHGYNPAHRGEYGCHEHTPEDEPSEFHDMGGTGEIHRGIGVMLPDEVHRAVHDESRPARERAGILLDHLTRPENRYGGRLGRHWSTNQDVAEDFAETAAKWGRDEDDRARPDSDRTWGSHVEENDDGPYAVRHAKPGTAVVFHAHEPDLADIDNDPDDSEGMVYGHGEHGEREVPLRHHADVRLRGVSWAPVHDESDPDAPIWTEYTHHDFEGDREQHTAAASQGGGSPVDWDAVYRDKDRRLTEMHRGIRFWPRYDVHERVNDVSRPVADRAHELLGHIGEIMKSEGRHIGMSWTDSPTMARQVAGEGGWSHHGETGRPDPSRPDYDDRPQRMPVVLNAAWPDKRHIETRRRVLEHHGVYPYDDLEVTQGEIPLRHGAPADITGISWAAGDGERDQWTHHTFDPPVHYNGSEFEHPGRTASATATLMTHFEGSAAPDEDEPTYYHVSPRRFTRGTILEPQGKGGANFDDSTGEHVYMTPDENHVEQYRYRLWEQGHPEQHVYEVRPHGPVEPDPNDPDAVRTRHPVEVTWARDGDDQDGDWFEPRTASRPGRGEKACACCNGDGIHNDGSTCEACDDSGTVPSSAPDTRCPGQPQPKRRHWRQGAYVPAAERTESVRHILDHYLPSDFDSWQEVRDNNDWNHPLSREFVEDIRRNGVQRPIPIDYEQDPPRVMNGHTRTLGAERAGVDTVPTRQHRGWMDPDDPDSMGRQPDHPEHWVNAHPEWLHEAALEVPASAVDETSNDYKDALERTGAMEIPQSEDIFATPRGTSPVAEHAERAIEQAHAQGRSHWRDRIHPLMEVPDHVVAENGPYHVARDPEREQGESAAHRERYATYHVLDREGRSVHPFGRGHDGSTGMFSGYQGAMDDWHRLTHRQDPADIRYGRNGQPKNPMVVDSVEMHRQYAEHLRANPPQFPHSRTDPYDEEIARRPQARVHEPSGYSPSDEYHGSYEVVQHPQTGRFHVIDNQGRHAGDSRGFEGQHQAEKSRDYIDKDRRGKEVAKGFVEKMWNGTQEAMDPGGTTESRQSDRNINSASELMTRYDGGSGQIKFDSDEDGGEPYYELEHHHPNGQPSGWYAKHYGGPQFEIHHRATGDEQAHESLSLPSDNINGDLLPGYGHEDLARDLKNWHDEEGGTRHQFETEDPRYLPGARKIQQWKRRHLGAAQEPVAEIMAHFAASDDRGANSVDDAMRTISEMAIAKGHRPVWTPDDDRPRYTSPLIHLSCENCEPSVHSRVKRFALPQDPAEFRNEMIDDPAIPEWLKRKCRHTKEKARALREQLDAMAEERRGGTPREGSRRQQEGDERPYGDYTMRYRTEDQGESKPRHVIETIHPDGSTAGRLTWYGTTGKVYRVETAGPEDDGSQRTPLGNGQDHRRRGIATAMWDWSQEMTPRARHSNDQTTQGTAWARALGRPRKEPPSLSATAASEPGVTVEHRQTPSGGATYPHMHSITATHPDGTTAELRYMTSKRDGRGVVDHAYIPGGYARSLGVPLVQEARRLHPGTFVKGLPGLDEDWGRHLPSVSSLHRHLTVKLEPSDRDYVHDESVPRAQRARFLMDLMARGGPSMHWASQRGRAAAEGSFGDHEFRSPEHTQIAINADPPAPEHVEDDPERISRNGGYAYQAPDWEVPLKGGAPVTVNSVRWRTGGSGWTSHQFRGGHQFTAGAIAASTQSEDAGQQRLAATNWDQFYDKIPAEIHRGLYAPQSHDVFGMPMSDEDIAHGLIAAHQEEHFPYQRDRHELFGTHWTASEQVARDFAHEHEREHHEECDNHDAHLEATPVVFHAERPARHEIETDPRRLGWQNVDDHDGPEREVPIRHGSQVRVTGVSWQKPTSMGPVWHRHDLREPVQLRAEDRDSPDDPDAWNDEGDRPSAQHQGSVGVVAHFAAGMGEHVAALINPHNDAMQKSFGVHWDPEDSPETWYHGSPYAYRRMDSDHLADDYDMGMEPGHEHWNNLLGGHFAGHEGTAANFVHESSSGSYEGDRSPGYIYHARLHIKNPRHYPSEFDMDREVYGHEFDQGNHPVNHDPDFEDEWAGDPNLSHHEDLRKQPDTMTVPDQITGGTKSVDNRPRFMRWLSTHPDKAGIAERFKSRLEAAGHHGITYGNEIEHNNGGTGGTCAIAFHPHQVQLTQRHEYDPKHDLDYEKAGNPFNCKRGAEAEWEEGHWPTHDQPELPFGEHRAAVVPDVVAHFVVEATAGEYGPKPEFAAAPGHLSDDEKMAHWERQRQVKQDWESRTLHGISTGAITPEHAKSLGYYFDGHQTDRWGDHTWRPLPRDLYHVTTDLPGVRASGLKTRDELAQTRGGHGLGGGPEDMISLTDDHPTAQNILRAVHEFHHVVNGRYTPAQMWEDAKAGVGAARPFHEDLAGYHQSGWKEGDPLPRAMDAAIRQKEIRQGGLLYTPEEMARHHGPGWVPHRDADELTGRDGRKLYNVWERDANPELRRERAADFYKNFAAYRENAGGRENPLFFGTDTKAFAAKDPAHFAIVHARPKPGAMGHQVGALGEWRTGTGDAIEAHRAERMEDGHLKEAALIHGEDEDGYQEEPRHTLHPEAQCPSCGEPAFGEKGARTVHFTLGDPEGTPEPVPSSIAQCNNCGEMYPAHKSGEQARADRELAQMNHANHISDRQGGDELFRHFTEQPTEPVIGWDGARELVTKWNKEEQQFGGPGSVPLPQGHPMARSIREHRFNRVLHDPAASRPIELRNPAEDITRLSSATAALSATASGDAEEMWGHLREFHGVSGDRTPGADFMNGLHDRFHSGQIADHRRVPHQHDEPVAERPARDLVSRMFTPIPAEELEAQRRAREPKPERLDDRDYSIRDVSRHYDWEGFDPHEISHLVRNPEQATFTREDVPVHTLRHVDEHGGLVPPPSYRDIADQGDDERERLEELERGYDNGEPVPPIVAVRDGEHHIIADGSHRAAIHAERRSTHIPAFVTQRTIYPEHRREASHHVAYDRETDEGPFEWNEIAQRHPDIYGGHENEEDYESGDSEGDQIGDAASHLYHDRPGHPYDETYGGLHPVYGDSGMVFHPRTVDPSRIDYHRSEPGDPRVAQARRGYESQTPERVPPVILVHRHGVFMPADGHHRSEGAAKGHRPVRAYVAYSPHEDEPFSSGERGPFHGAETEERPAMRDQNGVPCRISYPGFPHTAEVPRPTSHEAALVEHFEDRPGQIVYANVHDQVPALPAAPAGFFSWPGLPVPEDPEQLMEMVRDLPGLLGVIREELRGLALRLAEEAPLHPSVVDMIWEMAASCRTAQEDMGRLGISSPEGSWEEPGPGPKA